MRFRVLLLLPLIALLGACSAKQTGGHSTISFRVPSVGELSSKSSAKPGQLSASAISGSDISWDKACFMLNVTASDIPSTTSNTCQVPVGVFIGSVAPGTTNVLSLSVPKGPQRKIEVFGYFRLTTSEPCAVQDSVNKFDRSRTALLGSVTGVSTESDDVSVDITINQPSQMIAAQYNLPPSCSVATGPKRTDIRPISGAVVKQTTASNYKFQGSVGGPSQTIKTTPNGYKVYRKVRK